MDRKILNRGRRAKKSRMKMKRQNVVRLSVHRTPRHTYASVISIDGSIIASASSNEAAFKKGDTYTGNVEAAKRIGKLIAERAIAKGVNKLAFDRSGFKYHGRVRALADAAREAGLDF